MQTPSEPRPPSRKSRVVPAGSRQRRAGRTVARMGAALAVHHRKQNGTLDRQPARQAALEARLGLVVDRGTVTLDRVRDAQDEARRAHAACMQVAVDAFGTRVTASVALVEMRQLDLDATRALWQAGIDDNITERDVRKRERGLASAKAAAERLDLTPTPKVPAPRPAGQPWVAPSVPGAIANRQTRAGTSARRARATVDRPTRSFARRSCCGTRSGIAVSIGTPGSPGPARRGVSRTCDSDRRSAARP